MVGRPHLIHAIEHADPIACLRTTSNRLDRDKRRARINLLGHHRLEFKLINVVSKFADGLI